MSLWCHDEREALLFGEQRWSVGEAIPNSRDTEATTTPGKGWDVLIYTLRVPVGLIGFKTTILSFSTPSFIATPYGHQAPRFNLDTSMECSFRVIWVIAGCLVSTALQLSCTLYSTHPTHRLERYLALLLRQFHCSARLEAVVTACQPSFVVQACATERRSFHHIRPIHRTPPILWACSRTLPLPANYTLFSRLI